MSLALHLPGKHIMHMETCQLLAASQGCSYRQMVTYLLRLAILGPLPTAMLEFGSGTSYNLLARIYIIWARWA